MDEKKTFSKEQKRTLLFLYIALGALIIANFSLAFTQQNKFSQFLPLSIALCGISAVFAVTALISVIGNFRKLDEKKRSVIGAVLTLLLCGAEIWMCVSAVNDLNDKRNAENSAVLFIKEKYGIDAQAEYLNSYKHDNGGKEITIKMTADGRNFHVGILKEKNAPVRFADGYQMDEVKQAVLDEISRVYPDGKRNGFGIYADNFMNYSVVEKYFDGTNLDEVMEDMHGSIEMNFVGVKFDLENPLFERLDKWNVEPRFVSFDTAEHRDFFLKNKKYKKLNNRQEAEEYYGEYAPYITDCIIYEQGDSSIARLNCGLKSVGEFRYVLSDIAESAAAMKDIEDLFGKYNGSLYISRSVTKGYTNKCDGERFYVFYPLEKLGGVPAENLGAAFASYTDGKESHGIIRARVIDGYALFDLPYWVDEFVLIDIGY